MRKRRLVLKFSGEEIAGPEGKLIDYAVLRRMCTEVADAVREGNLEVAIVNGGGNMVRGKDAAANGVDPVAADYMGMTATLINSLAIQSIMEQILGEESTRVMSALEIKPVSEMYIHRRAKRHLEKGRIVIFACGSGNPFFTTDTAAALRAKEIGADMLLKGTRAPGICARDPNKFPDEKPFPRLTIEECIAKRYKVMDQTAFTLCRENKIPLRVFSITRPGNIRKALLGEDIGTLVTDEPQAA
ncbi:MAG: UMP kinase [Candidatus Uhrbacteria bacterium]|nr:UMP kinase [Candidatus Uhrbacteria bacterium]